jgi:hypothetical protein
MADRIMERPGEESVWPDGSDQFDKGGAMMREKLEKVWMKVGKFLFWAFVTALCCCLTYMVFVHRKVIRAAIKGEPLPEAPTGKCCHKFCKKK